MMKKLIFIICLLVSGLSYTQEWLSKPKTNILCNMILNTDNFLGGNISTYIDNSFGLKVEFIKDKHNYTSYDETSIGILYNTILMKSNNSKVILNHNFYYKLSEYKLNQINKSESIFGYGLDLYLIYKIYKNWNIDIGCEFKLDKLQHPNNNFNIGFSFIF